jgi:hypothetical protein
MMAGIVLKSGAVVVGEGIDLSEAMYDKGWSDGLPLTPPTKEKVVAMLLGTPQPPAMILGSVAPNVSCHPTTAL